MAVSWPSLVATMAVLTIAHAATQFGKPNQNTGFTRPPVTQAVYVNTIPEFIEARKFPEISCIRTFDMSGRRDQLLDTPLKRANFLSGLRGDKLTVFGQITGNPECDVSIYTPEHMHRALDYLVHEMDATERDIFFTAPLTLPTMNPGDIARAIQKWTPLIQLLKNRDFLIESNNVIPIDMFGVMCDNLLVNRSTLLETLLLNDRLPDCSSLLITERHVDNNTGVFPDVGRGKAFYAKLRQTTPDWDLYMLRFCPEALTPGDIDRIQSQNFFDPQQLDVISGERELFWRLPGKVKDRILDKLTQSYGPFLSWSPDLIEKMSHYVFMTAPGDILNLAPIQTFFEIEVPSDEELEETPEVKSFFRSVAWQAADYLNDPANLATFMSLNITVKSNVFCLLAKFAQVPSVIQLSFDMMDRLAGIQHCQDMGMRIDYGKLDFLLYDVMSQPGFTWDYHTMLEYDPLLPFLPYSVFENISTHELMEYWPRKNATFPVALARDMWNRAKNLVSLPAFTCMEFEIVKESVLTMTEDDLMQIPLETFCECSHFYVEFLDHRCEHNPRTCEAFWEKILESCMVTGLPVVNVLEDLPGYFIQHFVPPEDMEHLDMNDTAILDRIADIPLDDIHATVLYRKLEKELGNISFYDHPDFNKNPSAYKLYSKGMTTDHAHSMRADDTFIDMLPTLATSFEQSNKKKTAMIYEKIAESFNLGSARDVCVDESMVADVAPYFIQASEEDMRKLTPDSRYNILKQIGETKKYTRKMTRPKIRLFFALQLETKDVRAPYDSADIEAVGKYLWCGMDASHVTHVSSQAIEEYLHVFDSCDQLDQETRKELSDTYVNYVGGIFSIIDQPDKAEAMGSLLMYVDITTASTLPAKKDKLEKFEVLMSEVLELAESRSRRLQEKSGRDIPEEEKETEKRFRKSLTHGLFGVKHTGGVPLDCRSLMAFHGDLSFLNETDIVDMPMREFENCIEEFQKSDWNDDQFMAIGTKLKEVFGNDTSMWNPTMTMKAGPLIRGLDPMDLLNMTFTKDTLAVLGQFDLGANMSGDIVDKYARDMGMFDMSSLTVDELGALGKMVCGIAADMIATMDARTVSEAARHLKEAECLDTDQLEEFGKKLEEDLGRDWSHFTPDKIEELGVLMGGAPKDILETLGEQQISSIDPKAFQKMPAKTFAESFSVDKLEKLSDDQAMYLTTEHMWRMSRDQREAMANFTQKAGFNVPTATRGSKISDKNEFRTARNLARVSCGSGMAFAGQANDLLDTPDKLLDYEMSLDNDTLYYFSLLVHSPYHDVSSFTAGEMSMTLYHLMSTLDDQGWDDYLNILDNFDYIPANNMREMLTMWPPKMQLLQTPSTMCDVMGRMDEDLLEDFCLRIADADVSAVTLTEVIERCPDCVVLGFEHRESHDVIFLLDDAKAASYYRKLRQWSPTGWDIFTLATGPGGLKKDDIDRVDIGHFRNETQLHILADDYFQWSIRGNVKRQISSKLLQALGPLSVWTPDKVEMLGTYIAYLPRSTLKSQLTADFVLVNLPFIETIEEMDEVEEKALGIAAWNLADAMMNNPSFVTPDEKRRALCMIAKFAPRKAIFDTLYTPDEIKEGLKGCKHWNISKENSGRALSNVFSMNNFTWDNDTISMMADFSQAISTTTFDTMDAHTLQHNWDRMRDSNLSMPVLRSAWDKLKTNYTLTDVDCRDIHTMGRMFFALSVAELNQIPDPALGECGAHIGMMMDVMCDETPMVCNKIWEKVKRHNSSRGDSLGGVITSMGPGVLRFVPSDDLRDLSLDDLGGLDNLKNLDLDAAQSEVVMEIVEREFGAVSKDNMNYTGAQVEKLGHVFFKGASSESLQELPEGMELMETLPSIVANLEHMNDKKIKVVYDKLHTMFGMDKGTEVCLDESTVKQAAGFFSQATHDDLMQLDRDTRLSVLSEIGQSGDVVKTMTREGIKEHFKTLKEAENLNTRGSFTSSDLEKYGPHIFCGMDATDAQKLSTAAVDNFLQELDECEQLDSDTRTVIAQKAVNSASGLSGLANDPQKLESMGTLMLHVDMSGAANLRSDQKERLGSVVGDVMERVNKREKRLEQRSSSDIPKAEKTDEKMLQNNMARALWDVVADTIDCQTIQSFHGDLSFLTTADLAVIEADVVVECLTEFQNTDWDQDQLDTLGWKIKTQFGNDTGMWDKKTIMEAGKILGGLDPDDIQKMTLDKDIMGVLGQFQIADPEAMFQKFAQDEGLGNMSAVDADTMRSFGSMLCGMSAGDMMDLQSTVVLEVAKDLSTIDCLTKDQVKAIASRLEDAIPSNQWNQVSVEEMGVLAGGLEADKLEQLDDDQVSAISPKAIKVMKPDTFTKAFNADKMSKLTQDQVSAISPNMLRKMDIGQLIAIESVANGTRGVNATQMAANRTAYFHIEIPTNVSVKDLGTFQEVRNLRNDTGCLSGMSFGGQADDLLDTVDKQDAFALTLPPDHETLFDRLRASPDHDVGIFTTFEMRMVLEYLMDNLDPAGRDTYLDLLAQFPTLTRDEVNHTVTTWPPRLHLLMKPHLMCSTLGQMDVEVLNNFCEHLTDEDVSTATVIEMLNRCGDCLAVAHASRTDEGIIGLMSGFKGRAFYDKLAQWKSDGWDLYHLMFAPDTLEVEDVDRITDHSNYLDIAQIARLGNERFYEMTSDEVKQRLAQRLSEQLGELSDWSYLRQSMLLPYIVNMPPKVLKRQLTPSMVFSFLPYMEDILEVANKKFLKISAWKVAKYLIANSDTVTREMKQEAVCLVLEFSTHKKLWKKVYSANDLFSYMPGCVAYGVSEKRITEVVKKVIRSNAFEWNQEGIEMIAPFIAAVPKSLLKNVNASLLYDNWGLFSNANFSMGTLRMLWKRVQSKVDLASVTCNEIQRLGRVFLALRVNEMNQISDVTMHECLGYLGEIMEDSCSENKWLCKNVWDKVKKYIKRQGVGIGTVIKHLGAGFVRYLPREDMEEIDLSDLGDLTTLSDLKVNIEHAPIFMRKVVGVKGPISLSNTNYSAHALMQLGSVFYHGATGPEFEFLPEDPSLFEMLPDMAMHFADINEKKIEIVYSKIKKILGVNTTTDICLDRALAEQVAMFFTAASADDLRKFSADTRKVIIKTIGQRYDFVKRMTRQKIQEIFSVMMELDSLGSKGSYDENDMEEFGYMWCGQKSTQAFKLSETAIDQFMGVLKDCVHFEPNTRGALVSKSISISGGLSSLLQNNPQRLEDMGSMIVDIDVNLMGTLDTDSQQVFVSSTQKVMESLGKVQKEAASRPSSEISDTEKDSDKAKVKKLTQEIFSMHLSVSFSKRRKRSTPAADCATIQSFNGALSFLTASDISAMSNSEFTDCLAEFQTTSWDSSQLEAFAAQLIDSFGSDSSTWTKDNVLDAGVLLDALNSTHILNLTVIDDDALSTLGTYTFTNNAAHIMTSYMTTQNIADVSTISASVLGNTGNLLCGFNSTQMQSLDSNAVDTASSDLSSVSCLESDQLTTLSNKIVEVQGTDWSTKTADQITTLGVLAGGLPASVLEDLGSDQLASISTVAIANMDTTTFSTVFTVDKISSLSSSQANAVTQDQLNSLSADQLSAVTAVATTTTAGGNGASGVVVSIWTLCLLLLAAAMPLAV